jgi:hypothetical protein
MGNLIVRTSRQDYATPHQISIKSSLTSVTETATAGWRVRFVECCGRDCNEAARQFMTHLCHRVAKFAVMQNAASTSREGDDVIAPRVEGRVARH